MTIMVVKLSCTLCEKQFPYSESFGISHPPLMRDDFYEFHCSSCTNGPIYYKRKPMSWLQVIWLSMYNLLISDPSKKFVKWKDELCSFIDIHWENLTPGKKKTTTWHNTVASVLSVQQNKIFISASGIDSTQAPGNWTLKEFHPPTSNSISKSTSIPSPKSSLEKNQNEIKTEKKSPKRSASPRILSSQRKNALKTTIIEREITGLRPFSKQEEENLLAEMLKSNQPTSAIFRRLRRKLIVREIWRSAGREPFNIDKSIQNWINLNHLNGKSKSHSLSPSKPIYLYVKCIPHKHCFKSKLYGRSDLDDGMETEKPDIISPYTGKPLPRYIWRDYESTPAGKQILEILNKVKENDDGPHGKQRFSIDYCHLRNSDLPQVNFLLSQMFWEGVDVSEALSFPDFTIVAYYKDLLIGCGFITPEGYIMYLAVRCGWNGHGIGSFMLFFLIQANKYRDVTLHVSATNRAMLLYQRFGFKPEQYVIGFYDKYLPAESRECKNAFLLRLRR